jgi:hypothetical protein
MPNTDLETRVTELERKIAELHAEAASCESVRFRRTERREMERRAAMSTIGRLEPDERLARVRAMSTAELALFWNANTDETVLETLQAATAEERAAAFHDTVLALSLSFLLCFAIFVVFPVQGPRYLGVPEGVPDGPVRRLVVAILERGSASQRSRRRLWCSDSKSTRGARASPTTTATAGNASSGPSKKLKLATPSSFVRPRTT